MILASRAGLNRSGRPERGASRGPVPGAGWNRRFQRLMLLGANPSCAVIVSYAVPAARARISRARRASPTGMRVARVMASSSARSTAASWRAKVGVNMLEDTPGLILLQLQRHSTRFESGGARVTAAQL